MAKASEQFRQSDVALWGIVALVCGGLAVLGSNVAAMVPQSVLGGLHQPRIAGSSIETLRQQVADLSDQTTRLQRENTALLSRLSVQEKSDSDVVRRVAALEVSMPKLLEAIPDTALVDRGSVTASITADDAQTFAVEGGTVAVRQVPMAGTTRPDAPRQPLPQALPAQVAAIAPAPLSYGVQLGAAVPPEGTQALWADLDLKLGPLLLGLVPLVADDAGTSDLRRIIVGPFEELSVARALCERFERVSIACAPSPYSGTVFVPVGEPSEGG